MNKRVEVKLKVKGICKRLKVDKNQTIANIINMLIIKQPKLFGGLQSQMQIVNSYTCQQLNQGQDMTTIVCNQSNNVIQIQIRDKSKSMFNIANILFDPQTQQNFRKACEYILNNQSIQNLYRQSKISRNLYQLLTKIKTKLSIESKSKIQIQKMQQLKQKTIQKQKQLASKIDIIHKQYQNKLKICNQQCQQVKDKLKKNDQQLQKCRKQLKAKDKQIQQYRIKLKSKDEQSQKNIKRYQSQSEKYMIDLVKQKQQKQSMKKQHQMILLQAFQSVTMCQNKSNDILYKSKTFQIQKLKPALNQYSNHLQKYVQSFCANKIKEITSQFYIDGKKPTLFIDKMKNTANFILLFSSNQKVFGIFSPLPMNSKNFKSGFGFLFSLSTPNMYQLLQKQIIWRQSSLQLKIGNDCLTMSQPKDHSLKLKYKKQLNKNFKITEDEIKQIFGEVKQQMNIDSFQMLVVSFEGKDKFQYADNQIYQSVRIKTEEDRN